MRSSCSKYRRFFWFLIDDLRQIKHQNCKKKKKKKKKKRGGGGPGKRKIHIFRSRGADNCIDNFRKYTLLKMISLTFFFHENVMKRRGSKKYGLLTMKLR